MFHFSHNSQRRRAIEVAIRLDSHNVCNEQPHQMNRKQSARTQQNSSKMKHAFTASLNGTTHRMPSHWPVSVAITIISIKWLSNNYIINSFYFLFFVQRPPHAAEWFLFHFLPCAADTCMHAGNWMRAMCTQSKSIGWPSTAAVVNRSERPHTNRWKTRTVTCNHSRFYTNIQMYLTRALDH